MKICIDLISADLRELNDPETTEMVIREAHAILDRIFEEKMN